MEAQRFRLPLYLPAQGAAETEATIIEWFVAEGDEFNQGDVLAQIDSAKSVFDFQAPCRGRVIRLLRLESETVPYTEPVMEIETSDPGMKDWIPPAAGAVEASLERKPGPAAEAAGPATGVVLRGIGGYLPSRIVTNAELVQGFPQVAEEYVYQVTGIRQRRWAAEGEKPSDMAYAAALEAIRHAGVAVREIDAIVVATTTPDFAMPSTACVLQDRLGRVGIPAFDVNAACSGWLYAVAVAQGLILSQTVRNALVVGVELQSRLLDAADRSALFLFGDGAGAAILAAGTSGHRLGPAILGADSRGLRLARRSTPGYLVADSQPDLDPWIRIDGAALFRVATEGFIQIIRQSIARAGWTPEETRWVVPHQANSRILKAVARRSGVPFNRFYINMEHVGNTSSASIPLALSEIAPTLQTGDKLILCSVGAGVTTAAVSLEW
ncbi:MAG: beta-ketoacyl-ACP synthase 3 [Thermoguttaceae bacterium]|jgi:3-oxoacyl-[acyl-carrier-protein] synthase-3|nr:beta-ketoacyl-ACP synthase 3 [Thermoguttaceae bacterium]